MKDYYFSTKKNFLNKDKMKIWQLLKDCFWSKDVPIEYIERFIKHSLCFGIYEIFFDQLIGFGRVISDYTTYAYVCDVVIDPLHRRKGLGKALINEIMSHAELQGLKTWTLRTTEDARQIYENKGFVITVVPETQMEINDPDIYSKQTFINLHE